MRTTAPPPFSVSFLGPEGPYTIHFQPDGRWDGLIDVTIGGMEMQWAVDDVRHDESGALAIGGMTRGSEDLWGQQYWFELRPNDSPAVIRYWGDKVVWRSDIAT
ncbi:MAG: hypothetical protein Kow00114_01590 [Kiloniellaceae bacterium]